MPIYEYLCKGCSEHFERFQKISDEPISKCPKCGKKVKRLISQTSFTLKGDGWYKDGYSAKGNSKKSTESPCKAKSCDDCCKKSTEKKDKS